MVPAAVSDHRLMGPRLTDAVKVMMRTHAIRLNKTDTILDIKHK